MPPPLPEPQVKRAVAFVDGQNLYRCAKDAFGHTWPNCRLPDLAQAVCESRGWQLVETRFYTGVPSAVDNRRWHDFWGKRLLWMSRRGVKVYSRPVRYRTKPVRLSDGTAHQIRVGEEKGIDVRLALDVVMMALRNAYDVAVIFSQDQDLSEAAREIRVISDRERRWIKVASAFPSSAQSPNRRGIEHTDWIRIDRVMYDACADLDG